MTLVVIETGDGSHTFFDTAQNIYFRSLQGARSEADQVFVGAGRLSRCRPDWRVLELGLGTALNFLATAEAWLRAGTSGRLLYTAVEAAPLTPELFAQLGHQRRLAFPQLNDLVIEVFARLQTEPVAAITRQGITLKVHRSRWQDCELDETLSVDAIYHDPFGPKQNPEAWTLPCFAWSSRHLAPQGRLVTYSAATVVRRAMVGAGLWIAALPGPGTKREMTVAAREPQALDDGRLLDRQKYSA